MIRIDGFCPVGCGRTLMAEENQAFNRIVCWSKNCPDPLAAQRIINDPETEHIVHFDEDGFTIRHPLRERLNDLLMNCLLHQVCAENPGLTGRHRATVKNREWSFERITGP